jgi:hypothetical protein
MKADKTSCIKRQQGLTAGEPGCQPIHKKINFEKIDTGEGEGESV